MKEFKKSKHIKVVTLGKLLDLNKVAENNAKSSFAKNKKTRKSKKKPKY